MPQLPTADTGFGRRQEPQAVPTIAQVQTGAVESALMNAGEAITAIDERLTRARRASDLTNSLGAATEELGVKFVEYSRDQDFKTAPTRFKADAVAIGQRHAQSIQDPVVRQVFANEFTKLAVGKQLGVVVNAAKQESDSNEAKLDASLEVYTQQYAKASNDMDRSTILNLAKMAIGENVTAGWITDVRGVQKGKKFEQSAAEAVGLQAINDNAAVAFQKFTTDPNYLSGLDPVRREQLQRTAEVRSAQNDASVRRQQAEIQDAAREDMFQLYAKGQLSATQVARSEAATPVKEHYLNLLKAQAQGAEAVDRKGVKEDLWARIYKPYGDPNKLTSMAPITEAAMTNKISERTYMFLRNEFINSTTDEGAKLGPDVQRASKTAHDMLTRSMVGSIQPDVAIEAHARFEGDLLTKVAEYRKANKDPRALITPGSPDYMLDPKRVASYMPGVAPALSGEAAAQVIKAAPKTANGTVDAAAVLAEARAAIAAGKSRALVEQRLRALGLALEAAPAPGAKVQPLDPLPGLTGMP